MLGHSRANRTSVRYRGKVPPITHVIGGGLCPFLVGHLTIYALIVGGGVKIRRGAFPRVLCAKFVRMKIFQRLHDQLKLANGEKSKP